MNKIYKKFLVGMMVAAMVLTAIPSINSQAADKLKYKELYVKSINMVKPEVIVEEVADSSSSSSSASTSDSSAGSSSQQLALPTGDASSGAASSASSQAQSTASATKTTIKYPEETVKVMAKTQFVLSTTRYGKLIKTSKNKTNFKYKTSNKKVAKVNNKGVVTTLKNGKCDITVTNKKDNSKFILHLIVVKTVKVRKIKLNTTSKTYKKLGKTFTLKATTKISTKNSGDIPFYWYSTDKNVATVDQFGKVDIKGYGTCEIRYTAGSNGKVAKCKVTVINPKKEADTAATNVSVGRPNYVTGKVVDISSHNVVHDWSRLKQTCDAVIIRIGYRGFSSGTIVQDSSYASNVYNCQQYGIPYSVYFFTTATSAEEGIEEANWVANKLNGQNLCFPVFIDTEYCNTSHNGRSDGLSQSVRTAAVRGACAQLSSRGIESGVYGSLFWLRGQLDMSQLPYAVWVAQYASSCGYTGSKLMWQYTSSGSGYGVRTGGADRCDVSYWYQ